MAELTERDDVIDCLAGEAYAGRASVKCPHCDGDYSHVMRVGTLKGSDPHEATDAYPGTTRCGSTGYRRSAVEIAFWCELCHGVFAIRIQQHKGNNLIEIDLAPSGVKGACGDPECPECGK